MKKKYRSVRRERVKHQSGGNVTPQTKQIPLTPSSADCGQVARASIEQGEFVPYDENLLERARTQWQFGDWASLAKLGRETLQHHPDRAKLALLAAAGHLQQGDTQAARQFARLAQDWGCSKKLVSQILIAGVHNTLGRAAAVSGQQGSALKHFESAIAIGTPGSEVRLIIQARVGEQLAQLGLPSGVRTVGTEMLAPDGALKLCAGSKASVSSELKDEIAGLAEKLKTDLKAEINANSLNPYSHNRTMTPVLNKALREFAHAKLGKEELKPSYIDYLALKAIQIERNCTGRLATTVQDAVARQLVAESIAGDRLCVLEIGALYGISLGIIYNHGVTRFEQVEIACLDPFDGYYGQVVDALLNSPVNDITFRRNMQLCNVPPDAYHLIKRYSTDAAAIAAAGQLSINLLIIDGDHSYEGVKFDFDNYFPLLQPGGYVIFDDYNAKEWPDVQKFIDEDLDKTEGLEYLGAVSRTAVARKKKAAPA